MALADLPASLQVIELYNFEMLFRQVSIVLIIGFSLLYLYYIMPKQKETTSMAVGFFRFIASILSGVNLVVIPLLFFGMDPSISFWTFFEVYFVVYILTVILMNVGILADFWRYGVFYVLKLGGIDVGDRRTAKVAAWLRKFDKKNGFKY